MVIIIEEANKQLEIHSFGEVENSNNLETHKQFLDLFPKSKFSEIVEFKLEELFFNKAANANTYSSYRHYLEKHPEGRFSQLAQDSIQNKLAKYRLADKRRESNARASKNILIKDKSTSEIKGILNEFLLIELLEKYPSAGKQFSFPGNSAGVILIPVLGVFPIGEESQDGFNPVPGPDTYMILKRNGQEDLIIISPDKSSYQLNDLPKIILNKAVDIFFRESLLGDGDNVIGAVLFLAENTYSEKKTIDAILNKLMKNTGEILGSEVNFHMFSTVPTFAFVGENGDAMIGLWIGATIRRELGPNYSFLPIHSPSTGRISKVAETVDGLALSLLEVNASNNTIQVNGILATHLKKGQSIDKGDIIGIRYIGENIN